MKRLVIKVKYRTDESRDEKMKPRDVRDGEGKREESEGKIVEAGAFLRSRVGHGHFVGKRDANQTSNMDDSDQLKAKARQGKQPDLSKQRRQPIYQPRSAFLSVATPNITRSQLQPHRPRFNTAAAPSTPSICSFGVWR